MNTVPDNQKDSDSKKLESYELSPMQQGMLFHFLDDHVPGVDIEQVACRIREELDETSYSRAWQCVIERHPILRTRFRWTDADQPLQEVCYDVQVPVAWLDWTSLAEAEIEARWEDLKQAERERGFDLAVAPLMRLVMVKRGSADLMGLWTFHHILLDGRSFPLVLSEVFSFYDAFCRKESLDLPQPRPFGEYIHWLRKIDISRAESFWREQLKGFHAPTPLAISRTIPAQRSASEAIGKKEIKLSAEEMAALHSFAEHHELTVNTLLQGAWSLLWHRYSSEEDIVFGATRACRRGTIDGAEQMVGLFINTLPIRVKMGPDLTVLELLKQVRSQQVRIREFEHTPLVKVQGWSELPRGMALFDSILVYDHLSLDEALRSSAALVPTRKFEYRGQTNFPLTLIGYGGRELLLRIEYDRRRFEDDDLERLLRHLTNLLRGMISSPGTRIVDLPLLNASERHLALYEWNSAKSYPGLQGLHRLFEAQVQRTPDAVAVAYENSQVTYRELNSRSNHLALKLKQLGVGGDVLVGLCVERSIEMVVGILGILKAGGAYVPLDPAYPKDRLGFMIEDARMPVVVAQRKLSAELPSIGTARRLYLDDLETTSADNPPDETIPENIAYVIYTSGSTGKPKGVLVTHQNVVRLFDATEQWFHFDENDVWTLFHSYAFDFSVWELWGALLRGGRLVVVPYWVSRSPEAFLDLLEKERVTVLNQTPSAFRLLITADLERSQPVALALRFVIFGGEALELQSLKPWFDRHGDQRPLLVNMYGITETTVHVTYRPLTLIDIERGAGSVIGIPIPDLQVYVLDTQRQPVPIGVPGELYVGGGGVARGYLNRDELTTERFIADPFNAEFGSRLYQTGDLARRLSNGDLEYLGRIDLQVKIRGFRIELGEIEAVVNQHPAVRESVVIARQDLPGDKRLVAYIVADGDEDRVIGGLRQALQEKLPEYMMPSAFVMMKGLPLNENGKVDRRILPIPDFSRSESSRPFLPPGTPQEELLSGIWSTVLVVERVGVHDNFFELGGDSILSIQVISRCWQAGLKLTPRDLFRHPTVAELATFLSTKASTLERADSEEAVFGPVVLTPIQHWFFEQNFADLHHWNQAFLFEMPAKVDLRCLEGALAAVVHHHDAFRLRFSRDVSGWQQIYADEIEGVALRKEDLSDLQESDQAEAIAALASEIQASVDLSKPPLLRAVYFSLGPSQPGRLLIVVHHLVIDGVSWRILMEDLEAAFRCLEGNVALKLPTKTSSFQQWSLRLSDYARSAEVRSSLDAWLECSAPAATIPPRNALAIGENNEASARTITVRLSAEETRSLLQEVPTAYHTQINDLLLTALAGVLTDGAGGKDLRIDLEGHGREEIFDGVDLSRTLGWFTTIFPVRLKADWSADLSEAIKSVKEQLRGIPDRGLSYGVLRYLAERDESVSRLRKHPPAEILFNYLGQFDHVVAGSKLFKFASESVECWHSLRGHRTYAMEVLCLILHGQLEIRWIYSENLHKAETIERLASGFLRSLRALIAHCTTAGECGRTPSDFPLAQVHQNVLDDIVTLYPGIEDLYPLSPMQQLFYSMETAAGALGFEQWRFSLRGPLDPVVVRWAWERVLALHPILRSAFISDGLVEPHQVVLREAPLPWTEHDWRPIPPHDREQRLRSFLEADLSAPFDLKAAPLMRVGLLRLSEEEWQLIWSTHHLLIDGWSWPLVFKDLSRFYVAKCEGRAIDRSATCVYRDYIHWMLRKRTESESFWRQELLGFTAPTPLALTGTLDSKKPTVEVAEVSCLLSEEKTADLQRFSRSNQLTLSTVVQGAWALLLSHYSGQDDIVFGAAFSGRPPEIPGIEGMVGPCVNNLPVRVRLRSSGSLVDWLLKLQQRQFELSHHQYASLQQIQQWSEVPWRFRLFDSLLVFQNYLNDESTRKLSQDVVIRTLASPEATNYPLTLTITPGPELNFKVLFQSSKFDGRAIDDLLRDLVNLTMAIPEGGVRQLEEMLGFLPQESKGLARRASENALRLAVQTLPYSPPAGDLEQKIAAIWQDLFQVEQVGMDINFFDLGGHSLLLVQAHKRVRALINDQIPIVTLLKYPTIRSLARQLNKKGSEDAAPRDFTDRARKQREALLRRRTVLGRERERG